MNQNRTFASIFDGEPDPARPYGIRRNLERMMPQVEPAKPSNENRGPLGRSANDNGAPWRETTAVPGHALFDTANNTKRAVLSANLNGCRDEWLEAYKICSELPLKDPMRGGHRGLYGCAKGFVSERCFGNPMQWGAWEG
jgi:hypothetical protein